MYRIKNIFVVDVDMTLADNRHRTPTTAFGKRVSDREWKKCLTDELMSLDKPFDNARHVIEKLTKRKDCKVLIVTGRGERFRKTTTKWLQDHYGFTATRENLIMRECNDQRAPSALKECMIQRLIYKYGSRTYIFIDDDPYIHNVYAKYGIVLKAPGCWSVIYPDSGKLPKEIERRW
jgi:hypothetical protein